MKLLVIRAYILVYCIFLFNGEYLKSCILAYQKLLLSEIAIPASLRRRYIFSCDIFLLSARASPGRFHPVFTFRYEIRQGWEIPSLTEIASSSWLRIAVYRYHNFDSRTSPSTLPYCTLPMPNVKQVYKVVDFARGG